MTVLEFIIQIRKVTVSSAYIIKKANESDAHL
jgi:hypothetical protein